MYVCVCVFSRVWLFEIPWAIAYINIYKISILNDASIYSKLIQRRIISFAKQI